MTIHEFIRSFCNIPDGIEFGWVALIVSKAMRARTGEDRWDVADLEGDDDWKEFTYRDGEAGVDYGTILRALCDEIAGHWKSCSPPDDMSILLDLFADTGWDCIDAGLGLEAHGDSMAALTEGESVGEACQHVVNLSWGYRWWKRINGEDPEFNAEFGYGGTPNKHLEALGAAARGSLERIIAAEPDYRALLAELLEHVDECGPGVAGSTPGGFGPFAYEGTEYDVVTRVRAALEGRKPTNESN